MRQLKFATGNDKKLKEARAILGFDIEQVVIDIDEIQDPDVINVAKAKAKTAYEMTGSAVVVEDASLEIEALNNLPGAFIKFFNDILGPHNLPRLIDSFENKRALSKVCLCMYDGSEYTIALGEVPGDIVEPRGKSGFGFDPVFQPEGMDLTFAEMGEDKNEYSARKIAWENLKDLL